MEVEKSWRHRINVSQTSKGVLTFDCTVEGTGATMEEVLAESDRLVDELVSRYGVGEPPSLPIDK